MIVDTSALIAIALREPGSEHVEALLTTDPAPGIGAPTLAEAGLFMTGRLGIPGRTFLARLVREGGIVTVAFGDEHWPVAVDAFARFGKGRHPAALNFGDCLTYAVAKLANEPLLCVGDDFVRTDLAIAGRD